jgi:hypothetical protein
MHTVGLDCIAQPAEDSVYMHAAGPCACAMWGVRPVQGSHESRYHSVMECLHSAGDPQFLCSGVMLSITQPPFVQAAQEHIAFTGSLPASVGYWA